MMSEHTPPSSQHPSSSYFSPPHPHQHPSPQHLPFIHPPLHPPYPPHQHFSSQHLQHLSTLYSGLYTHLYTQIYAQLAQRQIAYNSNKHIEQTPSSFVTPTKPSSPKPNLNLNRSLTPRPAPKPKHRGKHKKHKLSASSSPRTPHLRLDAKQLKGAGMAEQQRDREAAAAASAASASRNHPAEQYRSQRLLDVNVNGSSMAFCPDKPSASDSSRDDETSGSRYSSAQSSGTSGSKAHNTSLRTMASRRLLNNSGRALISHDASFTTVFADSTFLEHEHEHETHVVKQRQEEKQPGLMDQQQQRQQQQSQQSRHKQAYYDMHHHQDPLVPHQNVQTVQNRERDGHDLNNRHVHNATSTPRRDPRAVDPAGVQPVQPVPRSHTKHPMHAMHNITNKRTITTTTTTTSKHLPPIPSLIPASPSVAPPRVSLPPQATPPVPLVPKSINQHNANGPIHVHRTQVPVPAQLAPPPQVQPKSPLRTLQTQPQAPTPPSQSRNININIDPNTSHSRRHQTVTYHTHDSSAFMYDESFAEADGYRFDGYRYGFSDADELLDNSLPHSTHQNYLHQPERYLDDALADPCGDRSDDEGGDMDGSYGNMADTSLVSSRSAASRHTQATSPDFSQEHSPAEFAKFIARDSTVSVTNKRKAAAAATAAAAAAADNDPQYTKFVNAMSGIYNLTDLQLEARFVFEQEIGFGNWGSVWQCRLRDAPNSSPGSRLGRAAAMNGGVGAAGRVAVKLAHRGKDAANTQRVHALWHEMKIIRSLRHDTHPSIIEFEAFVITPGYALIVMPFLSHLIETKISVQRARPYFRALASAVGYLHERGITHNDIKPANIVMNYNDVPVLVDFGFAKKHELGSSGRFLSTVQMGTPEYLDPQRVVGQPHDERASDVWSLGVTFYEILIGRTPFEKDEHEVFGDEDLPEYWHRTRAGRWLGEWEMPPQMESLLRYMICPDPIHRITALQAYHHPALQPSKESLNPGTPNFVREACQYQPDAETAEAYEDVRQRKLKNVKSDMVVRKKKRNEREVTPLGESIKQHTSAHELRRVATPTQQHLKKQKSKKKIAHKRVTEMKENKAPRVSESEAVHRPASAAALLTSVPDKPARKRSSERLGVNDTFGDFQASPTPAKSREEAVLRAMRHLEGNTAMEATREAERSFEAQREIIPQKSFEVAQSREEAVMRALKSLEGKDKKEQPQPFATVPLRMSRPHTIDAIEVLEKASELRRSAASDNLALESSPPRTPTPCTPKRESRLGSTAPMLDVNISTGTIFPPSLAHQGSPLRNQGNNATLDASPARRAKQSTAPSGVGQKEDNLDRLAEWAKTIEQYVEAARKARAEGRPEPPMPTMLEEHFGTMHLRPMSPVAVALGQAAQAEFGAGEIKLGKVPDRASRHRPAVSTLFRRDEKDKAEKAEKTQALRRMVARIPTRKSESQLSSTSPPSTLVDRSGDEVETLHSEARSRSDFRSSWRRSHTSNNLLSPPVHYSALAPPAEGGAGRMPKPSSMVSLRDKARALLGHDKDPKQEKQVPQRTSQTLPRSTKSAELLREHQSRPNTPGAQSVFKERKGLFNLFRRRP